MPERYILPSEITQGLIDHLSKNGYPIERIVIEWGRPSNAIDIAILAEDR